MVKEKLKYYRNICIRYFSNINFFRTHKWASKVCDIVENVNSYQDLVPTDDAKHIKEYENAFSVALNKDKVKNIAITGGYGSGKSSFIQTFMKKHDTYNYLLISMADFSLDKISENGTDKIKLSLNDIEEGIVQQLFYKVKNSKIPQSRFRKLNKVGITKFTIYWSLLIVFISSIIYLFKPNYFKTVWDLIYTSKLNIFQNVYCSWFIILIILFGILIILYNIKIYYSNKIHFEFTIKGQTVKNENEDEKSIFNRNLDEIVYFFEKIHYDIVIFEDLDRFENTDIFIKLRELNNLLNSYEGIHYPIRFVYAIKDDIFKNEERTKFFDFVIPIVPYINATNSVEEMNRLFIKTTDSNSNAISEQYIKDVAFYISDMRILRNIYNEFLIYKNTLNHVNDKVIEKNELKILSLIIFKNLYPKDFSDLQREKGIVKTAFINKRLFIQEKLGVLEDEINEISERLIKIDEDVLENIKEFKLSLMFKITHCEGYLKYIYINNEYIYSKEIMKDDFELNSLVNHSGNISVEGYRFDDMNYSYRFSDWQKEEYNQLINDFLNRFYIIDLKNNDKKSDLKQKINKLKYDCLKLQELSLKELIAEYEVEDVFKDKKIKENDLLVLMLRKGYIDENYADYMNYFEGESITFDDKNFILSIKNHKAKEYDYHLTKIGNIIEELNDSEFKQKEIHNFEMLNFLISSKDSKYENKLNNFIISLSDSSKDSFDFIDQAINFLDINLSKFINKLSFYWKNMWNEIYLNPTLDEKRKLSYFRLICAYADVETIKNMDDHQIVTKYLVDDSDILFLLKHFVSDDKIKDIIFELNIKFKNISIQEISSELISYIFDNNFYELNKTMLRTLVSIKKPELTKESETKNYSTLCRLEYETVMSYIQNNIELYVSDILLSPENNDEDPLYVVQLLTDNKENPELFEMICANLEFKIDGLIPVVKDDIDANKPYWDLFLEYDRISANNQNISIYYKNYGLNKELKTFITSYIDELKEIEKFEFEDKDLQDKFIKDLIMSDIEDKIFKKLIVKMELKPFDISFNSIEENKMKILIECNFIEFTQKNINQIENYHPSLRSWFILHNQSEYLQNMNCIAMNPEIFKNIIISPLADSKFKQKVCLKWYPHINEESAKYLFENDLINDDRVFNYVWNNIDSSFYHKLFINNLDILSNNELDNYLNMIDEYKELSDPNSHTVYLENNEDNQKLAKRLKEVDYITSFFENEKNGKLGLRKKRK